MSTARAQKRRRIRQTAAERKRYEEFDVQKVVPRSSKTGPFFRSKSGRPQSAKAPRNSTKITNATKRKKYEEFDVQKRSPNNLKNRPETRNSTCQTSPHVTLFMSLLRLSLGKSMPVVGRCHSSLSGYHRPQCSASCSCRPAHRRCKARAAELSGNACAAPDCSCIAPRSPGSEPFCLSLQACACEANTVLADRRCCFEVWSTTDAFCEPLKRLLPPAILEFCL